MEEKEKGATSNFLKNTLYYTASLLMPSILLFNLYSQNYARSYIVFMHVVIVAVLLSLVGILLFIVFKFLVKSIEGGLLLSVMFWLAFWLFEVLLDLTRIITSQTGPRRLSVFLLVFFIVITLIFRKFKPPFEKVRPVFNVLAFCVIVLFIINLIPGIQHERAVATGRAQRAELEEIEQPFYMKQTFHVDPELPSPDIYWFHMDGLLSIETVEDFWGLCHEDVREALEERGFVTYERAQLNAGYTWSAMFALLSPAFYDSFWSERLSDVEMLITEESLPILRSSITEVGLGLEGFLIPFQYVELFHAFIARGYEVDVSTLYGDTQLDSYEAIEIQRHRIVEEWNHFRRSDFPKLLSMTTPLPEINDYDYESVVADWIQIEISEPVAKFTWVNMMYAHLVVGIIEDIEDPTPEIDIHISARYDLYPLIFEETIRRMFEEIDVIQERNPNAVIVLQSDHGFHLLHTQAHMINKGYSLEQVLELNYSVFSAVLIPEEYGGQEKPIAPLNISRVLVNRFVGENYELLPE